MLLSEADAGFENFGQLLVTCNQFRFVLQVLAIEGGPGPEHSNTGLVSSRGRPFPAEPSI